jgi:hypothetical protein
LTAAESAKLSLLGDLPAETKAAIHKQIDAWNATAERYDSEPQTGEGRKELTERAKEPEPSVTANWPPITSLSLVRRHANLPSYLPRRRSRDQAFVIELQNLTMWMGGDRKRRRN